MQIKYKFKNQFLPHLFLMLLFPNLYIPTAPRLPFSILAQNSLEKNDWQKRLNVVR